MADKKNRRNFLKMTGFGSIGLLFSRRLYAEKLSKRNSQRSAEEMRPREILASIKRGPYAFIPVSPMFEWHSFHLPMGTDALICEELAREAALNVGGIWFRPLSFGLDAWRDKEQLKRWGFAEEERVYGMNFPDIPLASEYCESEEMSKSIINRIKPLYGCGIKHTFLINHHGGRGQFATVVKLAERCCTGEMKVHAVRPSQFNDLNKDDGFYGVGGHAGYSESTWLLGFRRDLVDLTEIKSGKLSVRLSGILHSKPEIEAEWNPRNISLLTAEKLKKRVVENFVKFIQGL